MRFSLKTAQLTMLAIVLLLGLPLLLPISLLWAVLDLSWQLVVVGLGVRAFYARGEQQAFALGGLGMGLLLIQNDDSSRSMISLFSSSVPWPALILNICVRFPPLYVGCLVGRWAYRQQLRRPAAPPAVPPDATPRPVAQPDSASPVERPPTPASQRATKS